jgi:hypothetical protein
MSLNMNFKTPVEVSEDGVVTISGTSDTVDHATLMSRRVVLRQGHALAEGDAPGAPDWNTEPLTSTTGRPFAPGDAVCIGTELHIADNSATRDPVAAQVTVTWSQIIELC